MILTYRLAQLLEMVQQRLVVNLIVDVKAVPQVATSNCAIVNDAFSSTFV